MTSIIEFLNQPIVISLITISIGSYMLDVITDRRSRKNKIREEAIEFLTEAGNDINSVISTMYGHLEGHKSESDLKLVGDFTRLYAKRMKVRIGSQAYLKSEEFHLQYERLLSELEEVALYMIKVQDSPEEIILQIQEKRNHLGKVWPIKNETQQALANKPADELMFWMDMILHRTTNLLTSNLKSVIG